MASWPDLDAVFLHVEQGIDRVVNDHLTKTAEEWWEDGYSYYQKKEYEKALVAYNRALRVKWLPPIPVNLADVEDLPATIHKVEGRGR